jgi:hypothetical protein
LLLVVVILIVLLLLLIVVILIIPEALVYMWYLPAIPSQWLRGLTSSWPPWSTLTTRSPPVMGTVHKYTVVIHIFTVTAAYNFLIVLLYK